MLCSVAGDDGDERAVASAVEESKEHSDEFLRNFFIKFGMKRTLQSF